jgi:hypothetical protein
VRKIKCLLKRYFCKLYYELFLHHLYPIYPTINNGAAAR